MSRSLTIALALVLTVASVPLAPASAQAPTAVVVDAPHPKGAPLRARPGEDGEAIGPLANGEALEAFGPAVSADGQSWRNVRASDGRTGWVRADWLRPGGDAPRGPSASAAVPLAEPLASPLPVAQTADPRAPSEDARRAVEAAAGAGRLPRAVADATAAGVPARVIVEVRPASAYRLEGELRTARDVQDQRAGIRQAQVTVLNALRGTRAANVSEMQTIPYMALDVDAEALAILLASPQVGSIVEDAAYAVPAQAEELDRTGGPALAESIPLINADDVWATGITGANWTVAVLDTGVDKSLPFLAGKVVSEACFSTTTTGNGFSSTSVCPGGVSSSTAVGSGVNCPTTIFGCDHGTHVAGIAAGKGNAFSGVAKDATIVAVQVFSRFQSASCPAQFGNICARTFVSDQIRGLERVLALRTSFNIAAVNMSLGGGQFFDQATCDQQNAATKTAIDNLRAVGIPTVIATGNDGFNNSMGSPACISTAISVGNTTKQDVVAASSNSVSFVTMLAPGTSINSSVPLSVSATGFGLKTGTSMATPHVAGAWALLKQKAPAATIDQVRNALTSTGVPVTDLDNGVTKPRIRLDQAANAIGGGSGIPNDGIAGAQTIANFPSAFAVNTANATTEPGEPTNFTCDGVGVTVGKTVWYRLTATEQTRVILSTQGSNFDTMVTAWNGTAFNNFNGGFCNDDSGGTTQSRVEFTANAGQTFMIQVGGFGGAGGALQLRVSAMRTITVQRAGQGTVRSAPAGIDCGADCSEAYEVGTGVALVATPAAGWGFSHWTGACTETDPQCDLVVGGVGTAGAHFASCAPRPRVGVSTTRLQDGRLRAAITAGAGMIKALEFGGPRGILNARVDIVNGQQAIFGTQRVVPSGLQNEVVLIVTPLQAGATTVPLIVHDACGTWPTFVGMGPGR